MSMQNCKCRGSNCFSHVVLLFKHLKFMIHICLCFSFYSESVHVHSACIQIVLIKIFCVGFWSARLLRCHARVLFKTNSQSQNAAHDQCKSLLFKSYIYLVIRESTRCESKDNKTAKSTQKICLFIQRFEWSHSLPCLCENRTINYYSKAYGVVAALFPLIHITHTGHYYYDNPIT